MQFKTLLIGFMHSTCPRGVGYGSVLSPLAEKGHFLQHQKLGGGVP